MVLKEGVWTDMIYINKALMLPNKILKPSHNCEKEFKYVSGNICATKNLEHASWHLLAKNKSSFANKGMILGKPDSKYA